MFVKHVFQNGPNVFLLVPGSDPLAQNLLSTAQEEGGGVAAGVGKEGGGEEAIHIITLYAPETEHSALVPLQTSSPQRLKKP